MNHIRRFLIAAACLVSMAASAQWQWIDKDGRKVFSDRAPPVDVLEKNILKRPGVRGTTADAGSASTATDTAAAASAPLNAASAPKLSGLDKELAARKKKAEEAEAAKRKEAQENLLIAKLENCARAKQAKATLASGLRMVRINEKGEREVLDQATLASEMKRVQAIIDSDCQ